MFIKVFDIVDYKYESAGCIDKLSFCDIQFVNTVCSFTGSTMFLKKKWKKRTSQS